jgi:hypothetical protein
VLKSGHIEPELAEAVTGLSLHEPQPFPHAILTGHAQFIPTRKEYWQSWPAGRYLLPLCRGQAYSKIPFSQVGGRPLDGWVVAYDREHHTTADERALMCTLAELAGQALVRVRLQQARMELAAVLQSMLPTLPRRLPGLEIAARHQPPVTDSTSEATDTTASRCPTAPSPWSSAQPPVTSLSCGLGVTAPTASGHDRSAPSWASSPNAAYPQETFPLAEDTTLVMVTDGVVALPLEAGLARAGALTAQATQEGAGIEFMADRVLEACHDVDHLDDVALLAIRRNP